MTDTIQKLRQLNTQELIDIVKNYRQYRYDETVRQAAIDLLRKRGISTEALEASGQMENSTYDAATHILASFNRNGNLALIFFVGFFLFIVLSLVLGYEDVAMQRWFRILTAVSALLYFIFSRRALADQRDFYQAIQKRKVAEDSLLVSRMGSFFFILTYLHLRGQMKEELQGIG